MPLSAISPSLLFSPHNTNTLSLFLKVPHRFHSRLLLLPAFLSMQNPDSPGMQMDLLHGSTLCGGIRLNCREREKTVSLRPSFSRTSSTL